MFAVPGTGTICAIRRPQRVTPTTSPISAARNDLGQLRLQLAGTGLHVATIVRVGNYIRHPCARLPSVATARADDGGPAAYTWAMPDIELAFLAVRDAT